VEILDAQQDVSFLKMPGKVPEIMGKMRWMRVGVYNETVPAVL
jgi:hypothetical protein